jgi:hypothetical protein
MIAARIAAEGQLAAITPESIALDTAITSTLPVLGRLRILNPANELRHAALTVGHLLDGSTYPAIEHFNISRSAAYQLRDMIREGSDATKLLDLYLDSIGVTAEMAR